MFPLFGIGTENETLALAFVNFLQRIVRCTIREKKSTRCHRAASIFFFFFHQLRKKCAGKKVRVDRIVSTVIFLGIWGDKTKKSNFSDAIF